MDKFTPPYFKENLQKRSPWENQSPKFIYSELPQVKVSLKLRTANMNESKTRVQDKCVDPDSPTFPPNPQQIKKL